MDDHDRKVAVEDKDWKVVEHCDDYYAVENHMMIDWMKKEDEVDDHMDEEVVEVYGRHLKKKKSCIGGKRGIFTMLRRW